MSPIAIQVPEDRDGLGDQNMYRQGHYQELTDHELAHLEGRDRVYYRYESGDYEGSGFLIGIKDGEWFSMDL